MTDNTSHASILTGALLRIKSLVCGDRYPRWDTEAQVTFQRGLIADIADSAILQANSGVESPAPIDSAKVEDTGEYANRMLSYELAGVIVDTETHGFDDACLATIKRVHDALLNATTVPIAQATGEADGWKLVPIKPTDDMAKAGKDQWYKTFTQHDLYVAMVSAAPTPSTQAVGEPVNFPYQKTFNAIAAATSVCAGCVAISVIDFREAFGEANAQVPMTDATPERKLTVDLVVLVMKLMRHLPKGDPESDKAMKLLKDNGFIHTYRLADKS